MLSKHEQCSRSSQKRCPSTVSALKFVLAILPQRARILLAVRFILRSSSHSSGARLVKHESLSCTIRLFGLDHEKLVIFLARAAQLPPVVLHRPKSRWMAGFTRWIYLGFVILTWQCVVGCQQREWRAWINCVPLTSHAIGRTHDICQIVGAVWSSNW